MVDIHQSSITPTRVNDWFFHTTSARLANPFPLLQTGSCILLSEPAAFFIQLFKKTAFWVEIHFPNCLRGTLLSTSNQTLPGWPQCSLISRWEAPPTHPADQSLTVPLHALSSSLLQPVPPGKPFPSSHRLSSRTSVSQSAVRCESCRAL